MRRWWLVIALVLSLGINIGWILQGLLGSEKASRGERPEQDRPIDGPPHGRPGPDGPDFIFERMADELGLDGEKRQQFLDLQRSFVNRVRESHEQVRTFRDQLRAELMAENPDRERLEKLLEQAGKAELERERAFVENLLASRELLDPEQERRFMGLVERLRDRRQDGRRLRGGDREDFARPRFRRPFGAGRGPDRGPGPGREPDTRELPDREPPDREPPREPPGRESPDREPSA